MKHLRSAAVFFLLLCLSAFAVTGVVVDGSRIPLQNVIVSFQDDGATTTTDEHGQFTLQPQATGNLDAGQAYPTVSVVNGLIHVSLPEIAKVLISTVDLNGRVMYQMGEHLAMSGDYDPLGGRVVPAGIYFVRYQAGSVYGVLTLSISESGRIHSSTRMDPVLKKTAEGADDSLVLEKSGYGSRTVAVADYAQDLDTLVLIWCGFASDCGTFADSRDGHEYRWVSIGSQTWMAENLDFGSYIADSSIQSDANATNAQKYCYDNTITNCDLYGGLYQWHSAMGLSQNCDTSNSCPVNTPHRGICPMNWHIPTQTEWSALKAFVDDANGGSFNDEGTSLKSSSGWYNDGSGTDAFGWTGLSSGYRYDGSFAFQGYNGDWWSVSQNTAWEYGLSNGATTLYGYGIDGYKEIFEFSVRCVLD